MQIDDLRTLAPGSALQADLCIVGSGPAGYTLARELAETGARILIVESGGRVDDAWTDALGSIESVGAERVLDQPLVRNRILGGTSHTWSGRIAPFDPHDLRERSWVANSGWPITQSDIAPFFARASEILGSPDRDEPGVAAELTRMLEDRPGLDPSKLANYFWTYSRNLPGAKDFRRFGDHLPDLPGDHLRCLLHATVTQIEVTADGDAVTGVEVTGADGRVRSVIAPVVVLAAGGIENARLLLGSRRRVPSGVGNSRDVVGRYLMDHPRGRVGVYHPQDAAAAQRIFSGYLLASGDHRVTVTPGVALSPAIQEAEGLTNAALWVSGIPSEDDPFVALGHLARLRSPVGAARRLVRGAPALAAGVARRVGRRSPVRRMEFLELQCIVEQEPDRDSRVTLADQVDALGVPLSRIDWRIGAREAATVRRASQLFVDEMARIGAPVPVLDPMLIDPTETFALPDVAHPMGTTRMSDDPSTGVVDSDLAVYGVRGLHVAGSSVFPTGGHANPTFMIVALAVRLARHLAPVLRVRRMTTRPAEEPLLPPVPIGIPRSAGESAEASGGTPPGPAAEDDREPGGRTTRPRILVTGASGRVGRRVVALLVERGYSVRALTSRVAPDRSSPFVEWRVHDLRQADLDFTVDVRGCEGIVHLGAELRDPSDMYRTNVQATRALAEAAEVEGVRTFCYTSTISVYGSQRRRIVDERSRVLTSDRDIAEEYWGDLSLRTYGRTKLGGELALRTVADRVDYVVFRPTVIVDVPQVKEVLSWSAVRRALLAYRVTHFLFVDDVAEAVLWALDPATRGGASAGVRVFDLGDEESRGQTFGSLLDEATDRISPRPFRPVPALPSFVDWAKDYVRYRGGFPPRRLLGLMQFPGDRLKAAGFRPVHGMRSVRERALREFADERGARLDAGSAG